ncbi:MAG: leucyl/phenylalanyl-tRNA--protein transferase [Bacteroidia bacterium]
MLDSNELLYAYTQGYFPMADPDANNEIYWYKPEQRGIIPLDEFHIPKNLKRLYRNHPFQLKINKDFRATITRCSERDDTWISEEIIDSYCALHKMGFAHSIECWDRDQLVGGLYGVAIRAAFFGESMFSNLPNTSKLCLVHLVEFLKEENFKLLDTQYINDHLLQFGAVEIPDAEYMKLLDDALS